MPVLGRFAVREREVYRLTDPGVMTLAARLYRFRPNFRRRAASILGEMAIGAHTGEWSRALEECGDDTSEPIEALEQVAERENIDLARPLSDLGHLTAGTRALWLQRLKFVADHPLGKQSGGPFGPRYDVPTDFLGEQDPTSFSGTSVSWSRLAAMLTNWFSIKRQRLRLRPTLWMWFRLVRKGRSSDACGHWWNSQSRYLNWIDTTPAPSIRSAASGYLWEVQPLCERRPDGF